MVFATVNSEANDFRRFEPRVQFLFINRKCRKIGFPGKELYFSIELVKILSENCLSPPPSEKSKNDPKSPQKGGTFDLWTVPKWKNHIESHEHE